MDSINISYRRTAADEGKNRETCFVKAIIVAAVYKVVEKICTGELIYKTASVIDNEGKKIVKRKVQWNPILHIKKPRNELSEIDKNKSDDLILLEYIQSYCSTKHKKFIPPQVALVMNHVISQHVIEEGETEEKCKLDVDEASDTIVKNAEEHGLEGTNHFTDSTAIVTGVLI